MTSAGRPASADREARYRRWRVRRLRRRMRRAVYSRLYRDSSRDLRRSVLVAGSGRSGTTWLTDLLQVELHARVLFEPFQPRLVDVYRDFHYFQYLRVDQQSEPMRAFCQRIFSGDIRHPWIDREVEVLRPRARIVKAIRANLLLGWIRNHFPEVPIVCLIRHPCAVVLSRMELGWDTDADIAPFLDQPDLVSDVLGDRLELIERAQTDEEKHAIVWCVHNLVPLRQLELAQYHRVFYESLQQQPEVEVPRLFAAIGRDFRPAIFERIARPSTTSSRHSAVISGGNVLTRWQRELSSQQIARILAVVRSFELGQLYDEGPIPLLDTEAQTAIPTSRARSEVGE